MPVAPLAPDARRLHNEIITGLGEPAAAEAIVIGSTAIALTLGPEFNRIPRDIDIMVPDGAINHLLNQPGWEVHYSNTTTLLRRGRLEVGCNDGACPPIHTMKQRGWTIGDGLHIAGLPDIFSWKEHNRGDQKRAVKDGADQTAIQKRLHSCSLPALSKIVMPSEMDLAWSILPEKLHDHPDAERAAYLVANALYTIYTLYGDPRVGTVNRIIGDLELPEYGALATYHNGHDLVHNGKRLQQHFDNITGISAEQRLVGAIAEAYSDAVYGNGRTQHNMAGGHDELRSAKLAYKHALQAGFEEPMARSIYNAILGTEFDEVSRSQAGSRSTDPVVRGVTGIDLQVIIDDGSVEAAWALSVENDTSARRSATRTLGKIIAEHGVVVRSTEDALAFIAEHPYARPSDMPAGPTIRESLIKHILESADFRDPHIPRGYQPVAGWTLDDPQARARHAAALRKAGNAMQAGMSPLDAYTMRHHLAE